MIAPLTRGIRLLVIVIALAPWNHHVHAQAVVELTIPAYDNSAVFITQPLEDGSYCHTNWGERRANPNGKLTLRIRLTAPGFMSVSYNRRMVELYVTPKCVVRVQLGDSLVFSGDHNHENKFLANRKRSDRYPHGMDEKSVPPLVRRLMYMNDDAAFIDTLKECIARELTELDSLFSMSSGLSPSFRQMAAKDAEYYYRVLGVSALEQRYMRYMWPGVNSGREEPREDYIGATQLLWDFLFQPALISENVRYSRHYNLYLLNYVLRYKGAFLKELESAEPRRFNFIIDDLRLGKKYLNEDALETFLAYYFLYYHNPAHFSQELLDYYLTLKSQFPQSLYLRVMEPKALEIQQALKPLSHEEQKASVHIIENFKGINDYETLVAQFKGKVIFVDIWATWCGPCIAEFAHYRQVHELQENHDDFVVLYLSRDRPEHEKRWEKFIHDRGLSGYHLIPNDNLARDLRNRIGWNAIPRYALINKKGELIEIDAPSPRTGQKLIKRIEKLRVAN